MTVFFVSRHKGAVGWSAQHGLRVDTLVDHLDPQEVHEGDTVIGSLPLHLIAKVCERGARFLHLAIDIPAQWRGQELTAEQLSQADARLEEYVVRRIGKNRGRKPLPQRTELPLWERIIPRLNRQ